MQLNFSLIWSILKYKKLRLFQLAKILQVNRSYLSQVLNGRKNPSDKFAEKIAIALHIDLNVIAEGQKVLPPGSPGRALKIKREKRLVNPGEPMPHKKKGKH